MASPVDGRPRGTRLKGKDLGSPWLDWTLLSAMKDLT